MVKSLFIAFFSMLTVFHSTGCLAQFKRMTIQVTGLTCSLCSKGVENALGKLPFVESVVMDLNDNRALINFNTDSTMDAEAVADKVLDAGFQVSEMVAVYDFGVNARLAEGHVKSGPYHFIFLQDTDTLLQGEKNIRLIGRKYTSAKEYKKYSAKIASLPKVKDKIYFVIL